MGHSWSKRFDRHHHQHHDNDDDNNHNHNHHHTQPPSSSLSLNPPPPPPPPHTQPPPSPYPPPQPSSPPTPPPPSYPTPPSQNPYPTHPPPQPPSPYPPPQPPSPYPPPQQPNPYYNHNYNNNYSNYARPVTTQPTYHPYFIPPPANPWTGFRPAPQLPPPGPPPLMLPNVPYVDHQSAKKIKNDINVKKDSIRLEVDELNNDCYLVCFTFDAMVDGSITILYFAKEGANCTFTSIYPEIKSVKIPFQKGIGQKFRQPSGSGVDLGFFDIDDLSKPSPEDVFPLVISAESTSPSVPEIEQNHEQSLDTSALHAQITQAVLDKNNDNKFQVKVMKQILWIDGARYELREIYGISNSNETSVSDKDTGQECVICMTEPKDTTVLPCRHMCMCSECAKELRLQSNKCPICRQPIEELLEIKVDQAE